MATNKPRFTITISEQTLEQVNIFRKKEHINTQSKAIQRLIEAGISDIFASDTSAFQDNNSLSKNDELLLSLTHQLNEEGQEKLIDYADDLVQSEKYIKSNTRQVAQNS